MLKIIVEFSIQALEVNVPPPNVSVGGAQAVLVRNPVTVAPVQPASVAPEIIQQPQNHTVQIHPVSNIAPQPPANTVTTLIPPTNNAVVKQRLSPMPVQSVAGMLTKSSFACNLMCSFSQFLRLKRKQKVLMCQFLIVWYIFPLKVKSHLFEIEDTTKAGSIVD